MSEVGNSAANSSAMITVRVSSNHTTYIVQTCFSVSQHYAWMSLSLVVINCRCHLLSRSVQQPVVYAGRSTSYITSVSRSIPSAFCPPSSAMTLCDLRRGFLAYLSNEGRDRTGRGRFPPPSRFGNGSGSFGQASHYGPGGGGGSGGVGRYGAMAAGAGFRGRDRCVRRHRTMPRITTSYICVTCRSASSRCRILGPHSVVPFGRSVTSGMQGLGAQQLHAACLSCSRRATAPLSKSYVDLSRPRTVVKRSCTPDLIMHNVTYSTRKYFLQRDHTCLSQLLWFSRFFQVAP